MGAARTVAHFYPKTHRRLSRRCPGERCNRNRRPRDRLKESIQKLTLTRANENLWPRIFATADRADRERIGTELTAKTRITVSCSSVQSRRSLSVPPQRRRTAVGNPGGGARRPECCGFEIHLPWFCDRRLTKAASLGLGKILKAAVHPIRLRSADGQCNLGPSCQFHVGVLSRHKHS